MIPHRVPFFLPMLYPSLCWRKPLASRTLFLTFDDGPVPGPTEFVLKTLQQFDVKATFFCIGDNIRKHPHVFQQVVAAGHAVGNHTDHHVNGWKTSGPAYVKEVAQCQQAIQGYAAVASPRPLFRPPYGRITRKQIAELSTTYDIIMWDVLSVDYDRRLAPASCLKNTIRAVRDGSIIVFHDSEKARPNLEHALPRFIAHCLAAGYVFKTLTA